MLFSAKVFILFPKHKKGGKISPDASIATENAGFFAARNGQLSANRLQKKFEDPKMAGEFFSLPFDKVK